MERGGSATLSRLRDSHRPASLSDVNAIDASAPPSYDDPMSTTIAAPVNWVEAVGKLHFPPKADRRLQDLMDRNNEGRLDKSERDELEALVELSEQLSLVRGEALQILGRRP